MHFAYILALSSTVTAVCNLFCFKPDKVLDQVQDVRGESFFRNANSDVSFPDISLSQAAEATDKTVEQLQVFGASSCLVRVGRGKTYAARSKGNQACHDTG